MIIHGKQFINWKGLAQVPDDQKKEKILAAIAAGFKSLAENGGLARIAPQTLLGSKIFGADPALMSSVPPIITSNTGGEDEMPDRGYEALFHLVDMLSSTSKTFDLVKTNGAVTFYQMEPGEAAKLSRLPSAEKTPISMLRFIGGFAILDDWLRFNELYKIEELTTGVVRDWYDQKADLFYGLLAALSAGVNQAFETDDVTTINNACAKIITDMQAAKYSVSAGSKFYITCHPNLLMRIYKALAASFLNANGNNNQIVWQIAGVIPSAKVAATSYYVSLPRFASKRGEWEALTTRPAQRNELVLGADHVWTGAYNGAIGESKQHRRCALS